MTGDLKTIKGSPEPLGLSFQGDTANFALFSSHATRVTLGLFIGDHPEKEISLNRTGDIWHVGIKNLPEGLNYAFKCEGPHEQLYNPSVWLNDPYTKMVEKYTESNSKIELWQGGALNLSQALPAAGLKISGCPTQPEPIYESRAVYKCKAALPKKFDWQKDKAPHIPREDLIIYEMHVRGFTQHSSSGVSKPGTYLGFIEKIPFLKELGINAIELMPIFEQDQTHCKNINPETKQKLVNYWGYDPFHFFVPKYWYSSSDPVDEFKTLVRELHKNGIEVILDVVYNHSGEEKDKSFYVNFRGIDNTVYYLVDDHGDYIDFTGCGNTINANHPVVQKLILDSLRYWVEEMHVDGFRFDLASVLTRDPKGKPMAHPPLMEAISKDPVLNKVKLIAEAWDAVGLYQLGCFPKWGPWSEWNGRYRDVVRRFIKGTGSKAGVFANVLTGSAMVYQSSKNPLSSINFITVHDGFTLRDLVTYQQKHNYANGEGNKDGSNQNDSWNCGHEGPTDDPNINALRERQMRNFLLALFLSQGIPMIFMGDVYGHTRHGNNNPYVQDNELNWFLWDQLEQNNKIFQFISALIRFRKNHPQLRHTKFLTNDEIDWHSATPLKPDWSDHSRLVAFTLKNGDPIYAAFNASPNPVTLTLPQGKWLKKVLTSEDWKFLEKGDLLPATLEIPSYSALLATTK